MKTKLFTLPLALALSATVCTDAGTTTPKREFRSTWFTTHVNIDWPQRKGTTTEIINSQKQSMIEYIEGFERMNLNGACFQVRAQCDAIYKSSYEPWSAVLTGTRGKDPGWDPLQYCIDECHKRGLECYAWINPFRWSTGTDYSTPQDLEFKQKGWILSYDGYYVLNPAIPEAREHILKVCREIVTKYNIDGVLFDDYFYPNNIPENSSAGDWNLYKSSGTTMSIGDWRRENINMFVRAFKEMIEEVHPDMRFGISPAGIAGKSASKFGVDPVPSTVKSSDWQYATIYSDPLAWLAEGSIDFISPQIYWQTYHTTAPYEPLCDWWTYVADHFGRHFYSSKNVYFFTSANNQTSWEEVSKQVKLDRKYAESTTMNAPGTIYYSSKYFYGPALSGLGDYLLANANQTKALVPVVTWKNVPTFGAPANLKLSGNTLTWTKIDAPKSIMRYTVYAVPKSLSLDDAKDDSGDGISNDYLLKVCYDNTFTLPSSAQGDFWYAVCGYDGAGNEFAPAVVNYPQGYSQKVTLTTPAEGAKIAWQDSFGWSAVSGAEYVMRVASDAAFTNIVYTSDRISTNSVKPDFSELEADTKYHWNVTCYENNKLGTESDTRSFFTPSYTDAPQVTLISPADGADIEGEVTFSWSTNASLSSYTLEVSKDKDFSTIRYTTTVSGGTVKVDPSLIGKGTYYWHVVATGAFMRPSTSAARSFNIASLAVGEYEPGYTIKRDPAVYETVDGVKMENLWMRAVTGDFKNIAFENDGTMERSMVAVGEYVYLTRRSENSQGAMLYLEQYDGLTGEHVKTITLGDEARVSYFPLNTVVKDDADNVVIANLVLNAVESAVYLHQVDLQTGSLREIARILVNGMSKARVDHVNVSGNVAQGNFNVYFAVASDAYIARVTFENGKETARKLVGFKEFFPADRSNFAIAPFVTPIGFDEVLVNGGGTGLALYNLATEKMIGGVGNATTANGSDRVVMGKYYYTVYPSSDHTKGFKFDIIRGTTSTLADAKVIATVPQAGIGTVNSSTSSTPISIVKDSEGSARVYVYAAGNGISAYKIDDSQSSIANVHATGLQLTVNGLDVAFNRTVGTIEAFTAGGALVASRTDADRITLPAPGLYLLRVDGDTYRVTVH